MRIDDKLRERAKRRDPGGYARLIALEEKARREKHHYDFTTVVWTPYHRELHVALALGYADAKAEMMRLSLYMHGKVLGEAEFAADKFIVIPGDVRTSIMSAIVPGIRALFAELQEDPSAKDT